MEDFSSLLTMYDAAENINCFTSIWDYDSSKYQLVLMFVVQNAYERNDHRYLVQLCHKWLSVLDYGYKPEIIRACVYLRVFFDGVNQKVFMTRYAFCPLSKLIGFLKRHIISSADVVYGDIIKEVVLAKSKEGIRMQDGRLTISDADLISVKTHSIKISSAEWHIDKMVSFLRARHLIGDARATFGALRWYYQKLCLPITHHLFSSSRWFFKFKYQYFDRMQCKHIIDSNKLLIEKTNRIFEIMDFNAFDYTCDLLYRERIMLNKVPFISPLQCFPLRNAMLEECYTDTVNKILFPILGCVYAETTIWRGKVSCHKLYTIKYLVEEYCACDYEQLGSLISQGWKLRAITVQRNSLADFKCVEINEFRKVQIEGETPTPCFSGKVIAEYKNQGETSEHVLLNLAKVIEHNPDCELFMRCYNKYGIWFCQCVLCIMLRMNKQIKHQLEDSENIIRKTLW
jgi:hypothetical protein